MILEYHRPETMAAALALLARSEPFTKPLGGGGILSQVRPERYAVVDIQRLGLAGIKRQGNQLIIGATATLRSLSEQADIQSALRQAIGLEANTNQRQTATVAGTLVSARGASPLAVALLALDARLTWEPDAVEVSLGDYLPLRETWQGGVLITQITISLTAALAYAYVARTPADQALVSVAVARWPSGRSRVAVGLPGDMPKVAMDGTESSGIDAAVRNAYSHIEKLPSDLDESYLQAAACALAARILANPE